MRYHLIGAQAVARHARCKPHILCTAMFRDPTASLDQPLSHSMPKPVTSASTHLSPSGALLPCKCCTTQLAAAEKAKLQFCPIQSQTTESLMKAAFSQLCQKPLYTYKNQQILASRSSTEEPRYWYIHTYCTHVYYTHTLLLSSPMYNEAHASNNLTLHLLLDRPLEKAIHVNI